MNTKTSIENTQNGKTHINTDKRFFTETHRNCPRSRATVRTGRKRPIFSDSQKFGFFRIFRFSKIRIFKGGIGDFHAHYRDRGNITGLITHTLNRYKKIIFKRNILEKKIQADNLKVISMKYRHRKGTQGF